MNEATPKPPRRGVIGKIARFVGWSILVLVVLVVVLVGGAFGLLQTGWGKQEVASLASSSLSGPGQSFEIADIEGLVPFDMTLGRLRMGDASGPWLEVDKARLHLVLSDLLHLKVNLAEVGAQRVALNRLPPATSPPPEPQPFSMPSLPQLPRSLPVAVEVQRLYVDQLELGQPVLGQAARFGIEGKVGSNDAATSLNALLDLNRQDQQTASLHLGLGADLAAQSLDLKLKADETGGLLAALSGRPNAGQLHMNLEGSGPLADWRGKLALEAQNLASVQADLALGLADLPRLGLDGKIDVAAGVLPPTIEPLTGRAIDLAVQLQPTSSQRVALQRLHVGAAGFGIEGGGAADLAANRLDGKVSLTVPDLAVASGLAGQPLKGSATLDLLAQGALRQPEIDLDVNAGDIAYPPYAVRDVALALKANLLGPFETTFPGADLNGRLSVKGLAQNGRQLGDDEAASLDLALSYPSAGPVDLKTVLLKALGATATLKGAIDPASLAGKLRLDLGIPSLQPLMAAAMPDPNGRPGIDGKIDLGADVTLGDQAKQIDAVLALRTDGLAGLPPGAMELLGAAPKLDATASFEAGKAATVQSLDFEGAAVSLKGKAGMGLDDQLVSTDLVLDLPDFSVLRPVTQQPTTGRASLTLKGQGSLRDRIDAVLALRAEDLAGLPAGTSDLLGATPSLDANLAYVNGKSLDVTDLAFKAKEASLQGKASVEMSGDQTLAADLDLALPRLAALSGLAGQPLAGSFAANLKARGKTTEPDIELASAIDNLQAAGFAFSKITLNADAAGPIDKIAGKLNLDARERRGPIALTSAYARDGQIFTVRDLTLTAPGTKLEGQAALNLATQLADGRIEGGVSNLAALAPFIGQPLKGSVALKADFDGQDGKQNARADIRAADIGGAFGALQSASVTARANDVRGKLGLDAAINAAGFAQPGLSLKQARVTATGDLAALKIAAALDGGMQGANPFDLATSLQAGLAGDTRRIDLQSLTGSFARQPIRLQRPAQMEMVGAAMKLAGFDLLFGQARLKADAALGNGRVDAKASLDPTPLAMFKPFGAPDLAGTVGFTLNASGSSAAPRIVFSLDAPGVKAKADNLRNVPPAHLTADATIGGGQVQANAGLAGVTSEPLRVQANLPLRLGLEPFAFDLPQNKPINGSLTGRADLARIADILVLDGQRIQGILNIDARFGGTLSAPQAAGDIAIQNGLIEDSLTGVMLRDLNVRVVGNQNRIDLQTLSARDRKDGTINGSGSVTLNGTALTGLGVKVQLANMQVYNAEFGQVWLSGDTDVSGSLSDMNVKSRLKVNEAEIRLPNPPPSKPPTLPVNVAGEKKPAATTTPPSPPMRIGLDVVVDMPEKFFVRGRGLESEWGGNVKVTQTADNPLVIGTINYRRGYLNLLDRRFDIDTGTITFSGAQPPIPELNIKATSETAGGFTGIVTVTGAATNPTLALTSDPIAPQDEVVSRIMFNRSSADISPVQGLKLAAAIQQLQSGGDGLMGIGRDALGVDTFDVSGSGGSDTTASAGKYISDDVFLQVQQGATADSTKAKVTIELTPNLSADTTVGQTGTSAGLSWTHDY
ncbi:Autotransporter translocation and assembly factor TamB [Arboricoccus pini]|uniref:Autotransporter translocation and assembly factor TamB n=1 Tax=Arboricoccus pini TaxID=1963835 RepID=A0A212PZ10_9PROT|nr:translocation/assembly module TamB domain-containing protein [Arboricoccus pini]SNB52219.1 Autotransporter translocation and assembly factor TamB [Arboricoccus pini]